MRRATITLGKDLEEAVDAYLKRQDAPPALTALVQAALREYLAHRGFSAPALRLRITPARKGSGGRDVSLHHDRYFAGRQ